MKTGILILKPDLFDSQDHQEELLKLLLDNKLDISSAYFIKNFGEFCDQYRTFDIALSSYMAKQSGEEFDFAREKRTTAYATFAYQELYPRRYGVALLFDVEDSKSEELYAKLRKVKKELRAYVLDSRAYDTYVDVSDPHHWKTYRHNYENPFDEDYLARDDVKLCYLNGIHLEEKYMYDNDVCLEFLKLQNVIKSKNQITDFRDSVYNGELNEIGRSK